MLGRTGAYGLNVLRSFLCVTGWPRLCPRKFADRPVAAPLRAAPSQPAPLRAAPSQARTLAARTLAARTLAGRTLATRTFAGPHTHGPHLHSPHSLSPYPLSPHLRGPHLRSPHLRRPALSHPSHSQPAPLHAATSEARTQKYRRTHAAPKYTSDNRRPGMSAIGKGRGRRPQSIPMQACVFYGRRTKFITHSHTAGTGLARAGPPAWLRRTFPRAH